jgi:hypothetical protein
MGLLKKYLLKCFTDSFEDQEYPSHISGARQATITTCMIEFAMAMDPCLKVI